MAVFVYWLSAWLVAGALVGPGWGLSRWAFPRWTAAEQLAIGPLLSLPIWLVAYRIIGAHTALGWHGLFFAVSLVTWVSLARDPSLRRGPALWVGAALAVHAVATLAAMGLWNAPSFHGGDHFAHTFMTPGAFLALDSLAGDRPALVSLVSLGFTGALGGDLTTQWMFQIGATLANGLIVGPIVLWAMRWGRILRPADIDGRAAAWGAGILAALNPFMVQQTMYAWPKFAAAAAVLSVAWLLFERDESRDTVAAGAVAAIAWMAHQQAALLLLPLGAFWLAAPGTSDRWRRAALLCVTGAGLCVAYLAWAAGYGYRPGASQQLLCPLMNEWWYLQWDRPRDEVLARFAEFTPWEIVSHRVANWSATFGPWRFSERPYYFAFDKVPAAMGVSVFVAAMVAAVRVGRADRRARPFLYAAASWTVVLAAFAGCVVHGLAGWGLAGFVAVGVALGGAWLGACSGWVWRVVAAVETLAWIVWWRTQMATLVSGHHEMLDPRYDDFVERDLALANLYGPEAMVFADDWLGHTGALLSVVVGACLCAILMTAVWRVERVSRS